MEHRGDELTGQQVHVRDHKQQPLGGRERRRQTPGRRGSVKRTSCSGFTLHHVNVYDLAQDVFLPLRRPLVHMLSHGCGGTDGVDEGDITHGIRYISCGLVTIHHLPDLFS